jgi:hypothetical protein
MTTVAATPTISPIALKEYEVKQSKYNIVGKLPIRSILLAPNSSGKTVLIQNMILDIYKDLFERVYIFSPSVHIDHTWYPVKAYLDKKMKLQDDEPKLYYDEYDPDTLENVISTHKTVIEYQKSKKEKNMFSILVVVDDFADNSDMCRNSRLLHALFVRGRHSQISTIFSTQKYTTIHPIIRVNASELYVFRLRNYSDLQTFLDELGGLCGDKNTLLEMYKEATNTPYSFLYCRLTEKDKNNMFYINYSKRFEIE